MLPNSRKSRRYVTFLVNYVQKMAVVLSVSFLTTSTSAGRNFARRKRLAVGMAVAVFGAVLATGPAASASTTVWCGGVEATIVGTTGADVLTGTPGVDVIQALGGNDVVYGQGGNDIICGGHGNDRLYGGDGADKIYAFKGADRLEGGSGPDILFGGPGRDSIFGNNGRDVLKGGPGVDVLHGGAQRDNLRGGLHADTLYGGSELDTCYSPGDVLNECEKGGGQNGGAIPITAQYTNEMFRLINVERAKASNLDPLTRHPDLDAYAAAWAVEMSKQPLPLSASRHHSPAFTGSNTAFRDLPNSVSWTRAFENVGYSTVGGSETPADVMSRLFYSPNGSGFMSSAGHRCNILETAATQVGVGSHVDSRGDVWVVQVFWGTYDPLPKSISSCSATTGR